MDWTHPPPPCVDVHIDVMFFAISHEFFRMFYNFSKYKCYESVVFRYALYWKYALITDGALYNVHILG